MTDEVTRFNTRHKNQEQFISVSEYTQSLLDRIVTLEKENAELKERIKDFITFKENIIREYKKQIEKMKNCCNCKHSFANGIGCMQRARNELCFNYALWELQE